MYTTQEVTVMAKVSRKTEERLWDEAQRMVRSEKVGDFLNDPKTFVHRLLHGYYEDRLVQCNRWLVNDEQQQIDDYYGRK
jgi:hypothetical protein